MSEFFYIQDVNRFHDKFGLFTPTSFVKLDDDLHRFRSAFFVEELTEYKDAVRDGDLATALDSLIDLIYIISGAALVHGLTHQEMYAAMMIVDEFFSEEVILLDDLSSKQITKPQLPEQEIADLYCMIINMHIKNFDEIHAMDLQLETRKEYVKYTLAAMFNSTLTAANYCGCSDELWAELWADVQRANMSKERALKPSDSKRGSAYDVIKPPGWIPPQTEAIIARHM